MHRVLYMQEILLEIFGYCYEHRRADSYRTGSGKKNLTALARTCKTFKEPALDILWAELEDLTLLVRCLPELSMKNRHGLYALKGPLEQTDRDILLGFTRRVRICRLIGQRTLAMTTECIEVLFNSLTSTATTIFPKLCELEIRGHGVTIRPFLHHLKHFTNPKLTVLKLDMNLGDAVLAFGEKCRNIATFHYESSSSQPDPDLVSRLICQWQGLRSVRCSNITLNAAAFVHLSRMRNLHFLSLDLHHVQIGHIRSIGSNPSTITLSALVRSELRSQSLATPSEFFSLLRLPTIKELDISLYVHPTQREFELWLAALLDSCNHQSLVDISIQLYDFYSQTMDGKFSADPPPFYINFRHLSSLVVFGNIQVIALSIPCGIDLSEQELLQLASSWPHLEVFDVGWDEAECTASSFITLGGFVQLLERCRSLSYFSFLFDIDDDMEIPQGHPWRGLKMVEGVTIHVRKSPIEGHSIKALGVFFCVAPFPNFHLMHSWRNEFSHTDWDLSRRYANRWENVKALARSLWEEGDSVLESLESRDRILATCCDSDDDEY